MRGYVNGSSEGHSSGYADGLAGRKKQSIGSIGELFSHVIRPQAYTSSYIDGYNEGWTGGLCL